METTMILRPPGTEMIRNRTLDFMRKTGNRNGDRPSRFHVPGKCVEEQIISPKVHVRIDGYDDIKEVGCKWQRPRIGVNGEDTILDPGVSDSVKILRSAE